MRKDTDLLQVARPAIKNQTNENHDQRILAKMITTDNAKRNIRVPAIYLWAAGQTLRSSGESDDLRSILDCLHSRAWRTKFFKSSQVDKEDLFRTYSKSKNNMGIIPFVRDDLDLSLGALVYGEGVDFKMHSDRSFVESGFLRVREKSIEYVDLIGDMIKVDSQLPEFLNITQKKSLLSLFEELSKANAVYQTVNSDTCVLKISGFPNLFGSVGGGLKCAISLWSDPKDLGKSAFGNLNRRLGIAKLRPSNDRSLSLTEISAQIQLELTAGSLVGNWLLIESDNFKSFGKLPDITVDNDTSPVSIDSLQMLKRYTLGETPMVLASQSLINKFSRRFPWFIPDDSTAWFKGIQQ